MVRGRVGRRGGAGRGWATETATPETAPQEAWDSNAGAPTGAVMSDGAFGREIDMRAFDLLPPRIRAAIREAPYEVDAAELVLAISEALAKGADPAELVARALASIEATMAATAALERQARDAGPGGEP